MANSKQYTDQQLLTRIIDGDMCAYEALFERHYSNLCAYARLYVRQETAENIVQDLMLWLWESRATIVVTQSISKYLFGALRKNCLTQLSHESIERRVLTNIRNSMREAFESPDFYVVSELQERIQQAVAELPELYRQTFEKNRFERKTYDEIALEFGISPKTVDYRIQQSLKILRNKLKDYTHLLSILL